MKTLLLLLVALVLSAQEVDKYFSPAVPSKYFTRATLLNGVWWEHATRIKRWIYLKAVSETLGRQIWLPDDTYKTRKLTVPVVDVIAARNPADETTQLQRALDCIVPDLPGEPVPSEYFTSTTLLNGVWWEHATRIERWIYLKAASETLGRQIWLPDDAYKTRKLTVPVVDVIAARNPADETTQLQRALDCIVPNLRGEPVSSR